MFSIRVVRGHCNALSLSPVCFMISYTGYHSCLRGTDGGISNNDDNDDDRGGARRETRGDGGSQVYVLSLVRF